MSAIIGKHNGGLAVEGPESNSFLDLFRSGPIYFLYKKIDDFAKIL